MNKTWFIIPARMGSKRLPHKNRILVPITVSKLMPDWIPYTIITTDDPVIEEQAKEWGIKVHKRSKESSSDTATMTFTLKEVIRDCKIPENDWIVCLYPTYPERTSENILSSFDFIKKTNAKSMLCKVPVKTHPWMCLQETEQDRGKLVVDNDLYRWQDFPVCFQYSHFVIIFKASEIETFNSQLFNSETVFLGIKDIVDIDTSSDMKKYINNEKVS